MEEKNLLYVVTKIQKEENIPIEGRFFEERIWEFLISLRYLANYQGEVVAFDYGSDPQILEKMGDFGVKVIPLPIDKEWEVPVERNLTNRRNIDVIPLLEQHYKDYKFLTYDFDCWFQEPIDEFWTELDDIEGCYYSVEKGRACRYRGPESTLQEYMDVQGRLGGFVWGGMQSGKFKPYLDRLRLMTDLFLEGGWDLYNWGADQALITHTVDFEKDRLDAWRWGFEWYCIELKGKKVVSKMPWYDGPIAVIHQNATLNRGKSEFCRFKNLHKGLWRKYK